MQLLKITKVEAKMEANRERLQEEIARMQAERARYRDPITYEQQLRAQYEQMRETRDGWMRRQRLVQVSLLEKEAQVKDTRLQLEANAGYGEVLYFLPFNLKM